MNGFHDINLSELSGPHLSPDDSVTPDEGYRTANHHLPSIPQGKELIIPVNAPPCYLHTTDVDATTVFTEFCARQTARLGSSGEAFSTTVEVKEQLITVRETKRRPSCSSKGSVTTSTDASEATSMDLSNSSSSSSSSTATTITTTPTTTSSSAKSAASSTKQRCLSEVSPQPTSTANPTVLQRFNFSPKPHGFFGRLRLFSHNSDRPKSINSTLESMEESTSTSLSPGYELSPPHLLPKTKNFVSSRLEFTGKPILTGKHLSKQRSRRLSGQYQRISDIGAPLSPNELAPDFARSCPDHEPMNCLGLMSELMSAVDILSARQNQWCSSNDAKSTIQVLKAAQSSTLLFVQKSVDEVDEEAGKPKDLRYFDEDSACSVFFKHSTCYDVLPESGKLLVVDSTLPIRRAMQALIDHSLAAAPVWCSRLQCYTQLLTTGLCLRLLAQAFPLTTPTTPTDSTEDDLATKRNTDPAITMGYWEEKTIGSVLNTFFNWAHSECPQEAVPETVTIVAPQDHLYGVTRILTLATSVPVKGSASNSNVSPPPRYVLIADRYGSGNLLGLLNTDRLLAYLRVRMRNLPTPSTLNVTVGDLPGIRWEERGWQLADSADFGDDDSTNTDDGRLRRRRVIFPGNTNGNIFYLHPTTTCREALHILNVAWSRAGLACLPVAAENGKGFQGMFNKHDILGTIFAGPLEVALNATIGTIMAVRPRHAGYTNQAMCFTSECLVAVLDRMFRQKAPCLAVFEKPSPGASWNGQGALGPAVGVITSSDLLHTIVLDAPTPPSSATSIETHDDVPVQKGVTAKVTGGKSATYGGRNKRFSLPVDQITANSVSGPQVTSPFGNQQHGLTRIFHRSKRYSEGEISPLEGPYAATTNSHTQRSQMHQPGRGTQRPTEETSPANQQQQLHAVDDGTLFEMDECV
ncbi:hypothetical protein ECG_07633 [Echinococcus granulosus]|nr:hypothetical protein ECG_07633 [Echinococcus granulosus]